MDPNAAMQFPFFENFQIRVDESVALKALFEKVFYGTEPIPAAGEALERIRFQARPSTDSKIGITPPLSGATKYILLNRGETGIGKTRVFRQFRQSAAERKIPVYEIHCYDVEGIPFKPFLRVIREILRDFEFSDALKEKYRGTLEHVLPEIYRGPSTLLNDSLESSDIEFAVGFGGNEGDMVRVFDALTQLLFDVTAFKPAVILVHDLHWGDSGTIELLRYIGRNLQLRNARIAAAVLQKKAAGLPTPQGPELADDDGEWREIISRSGKGADSIAALSTSADERAALDSGDGLEDRPIRLMILANYRGSPVENHYIEKAIRRLGHEPFVFHGEFRTLALEEAARFIERSLAEVDLPAEHPRAICDPDAVETIFRWTQGFPSYIHELFRLLFLSESARSPGDEPMVIDRALLESTLGQIPPSAPEGDGSRKEKVPEPESLRRRILERRIEETSEAERNVLNVLALARKPLPAEFLAGILCDGGSCISDLQDVLRGLQERFFIEKVRHEFPRRLEETGYCFRISDYATIAADGIPLEEKRRIHQKIAGQCRILLVEEGDEKAYEIFHHLRRGSEPSSAVGFGVTAARRFLRSFSLEKAVQVCDEVLEILAPAAEAPEKKDRKQKKDVPPAPDEAVRALRWKVLDLKAALHLRLREHSQAEAALTRRLQEGGEDLPEEVRLNILLRQSDVALCAGDPNRSLKILSKAFRLAKEEKNPSGAARLQIALAKAYLDRDDAKRAINFCLNGLKLSQKTPDAEETPELNRILARAHLVRSDYSHAMDSFQRVLDWLEHHDRKAEAGDVLEDLGRVYLERGNYFRAARYLYRSLEIKRREQDILGLSRSYDELGRVYLRTGDEIKTIEHLNRSLALKERVGDLPGLNPTLGILGSLYFRLGRFQRAIRYFKREIENSQLLADTRGLVDAFLHLGWVYLELGELKQVENLSRQVSILAGEFKLRAQQAEGARLPGAQEALERGWGGAEKHLRQALVTHSKLGDRRREAESLLDLAEVKFQRDLFDESLKLASKGLIIAEEKKFLDLQAHAQTIKGNVYRFLKSGNVDKAKECLRRGLELGQGLNDVRLLFDIFYSLAKVYHYDREFAEAGNFYGKAEAILRQVAEGLPEDMAARFFEDTRRKLFFEDAARFRKEVHSRTASGTAIELAEQPMVVDLKEKPIGLADYRDLLPRILKVNGAIHELDFCGRFLSEAMDLVKAERGVVLRVQNRQYRLEASSGFGDGPENHGDFPVARSLAEETIRKGRVYLQAGTGDDEKGPKVAKSAPSGRRAVLAVPILTSERVFGSLYLDRPASLGRFSPRDLVLAEALASHGGCAFENRRQYEVTIREPVTGFWTPAYFLDRLKDAFRWYNLHGRAFHLMGFYLPTLEGAVGSVGGLGEKIAAEVSVLLPQGAAASWWSPVLGVLLFDADLAAAESLQARLSDRLTTLLKDEVEEALVAPEARFADGPSIYSELRQKLLPEECDSQTLTELRRILAKDITLKEAKKILEKHIIESTLRKTGGNITHAAKELGIHRPQLSNLLKKHALKRELYEKEFDIQVNPLDN